MENRLIPANTGVIFIILIVWLLAAIRAGASGMVSTLVPPMTLTVNHYMSARFGTVRQLHTHGQLEAAKSFLVESLPAFLTTKLME
jgi:hypothetical protein